MDLILFANDKQNKRYICYTLGTRLTPGTHHKVYELQMNHSTWTNTTPAFKAIMTTLYQLYLQSETK
jgi:hypothetical protein